MDVFKDQWETQVRLLTEAVDDITTIDDFLAVSGIYQFIQHTQIVIMEKYCCVKFDHMHVLFFINISFEPSFISHV